MQAVYLAVLAANDSSWSSWAKWHLKINNTWQIHYSVVTSLWNIFPKAVFALQKYPGVFRYKTLLVSWREWLLKMLIPITRSWELKKKRGTTKIPDWLLEGPDTNETIFPSPARADRRRNGSEREDTKLPGTFICALPGWVWLCVMWGNDHDCRRVFMLKCLCLLGPAAEWLWSGYQQGGEKENEENDIFNSLLPFDGCNLRFVCSVWKLFLLLCFSVKFCYLWSFVIYMFNV